MKKIIIAVVALSIGMTISISAATDSIKFETVSGKSIEVIGTEKGFDIPAYKGKIVFTEFWGTHCPPCLRSIPHYIDLMKKYKDDIAVLAVEVQGKPKDALKEFVKEKGINYDIVSYKDGMQFVNYVAQRAKWNGSIPFLIISDKTGAVQIVQVGMLPEEALEQVIEKLLKAKSPKVKAVAQKAEEKKEVNGTKPTDKAPVAKPTESNQTTTK